MYTIIGKVTCPWCDKAEELLLEKNGAVSVVTLEEEPWLRPVLKAGGFETVPIIIDPVGQVIRGYEALVEYFKELDNG